MQTDFSSSPKPLAFAEMVVRAYGGKLDA